MASSLAKLGRPTRLIYSQTLKAWRLYSTAMRDAPLLITPQELKEVSATSDSKVVALDASWYMPNSPRKPIEEFIQKRLPNARFLDLDEVASPNELGLKHMLPGPSHFAKACGSFGIDEETHVVIYDSQGIFSAPRALFMFRAFGHRNSSVLDGGLPRWEFEGSPVEKGSPQPPSADIKYPEPILDEEVIRNYEQVMSNAEHDPSSDSAAALIIDARSGGRFSGKDPEPRAGLSSGHIPYSFSLPFTSFLQTFVSPTGASYTTFKPVEELRDALVNAVGKDNAQDVLEGKRKIVTSCGSGMTAGVLWLGLRLLGVSKPSLYDESWTGYAARSTSKIVKDI